MPVGLNVVSNGLVLAGLFLFGVSVVAWLLVLSRVEVGYAYPMLSLRYISSTQSPVIICFRKTCR